MRLATLKRLKYLVDRGLTPMFDMRNIQIVKGYILDNFPGALPRKIVDGSPTLGV